jgi:multidrug resistance efflux pump
MITVMTICYVACVVVAFKVIKLKVNPTSVAVATVAGILMLGGIVIVWNQAAPMSGQMILRRRVLQVVPDVREYVSKVHVKPDQKVKKGDPLFEVLPDRYQDVVDEATAELAAAKSTVSSLKAAVTAGEAGVKESEANTAVAKAEVDTAVELQKASAGAAIARLKVEETQDGYNAALANDKLAKAKLKQTQFSLAAATHSVGVAEAALNTANFNLTRCSYVSPVDGQVVNWQIREGTPVARWRFTGAGTVQSFADNWILAVYPQNLLKNVKPGNPVEIAFKRRPGQIVIGKVAQVVEYTGEGQFAPSALLPSAADIGSQGYLVVKIYLDDEELAKELPLGAAGTTAIYTDFAKPFHIITKITVRIKAWMYQLLPV